MNTPNRNPSPELIELIAVAESLWRVMRHAPDCGKGCTCYYEPLAERMRALLPFRMEHRALSPQTLPTPGEAERSDADLLRLIAQDHARLAPNAYHSAATLLQIADRLDATVAAANDEGVADTLAERLRERACGITTMLGEPAWKPSRSHIEAARNLLSEADAAIRLLSQGGGK